MLTSLSDRTKRGFERLKSLRGVDLGCGLTSNQHAKVIKDEFAADIIGYYANNGNQTAKISLRKFHTIGIRTWIKEVTGASTAGDFTLVQKSLDRILDTLTTTNMRLLKLEEQTAGYTKASVEMPGLQKWMDEFAQIDEDFLALPDGELFTLSEYLWEEKKLKFERPAMSLFSNKVAYVYKTMSEHPPAKKHGVSCTGYRTPLTNAYTRRDFPLLDIAFKQTVLEL